MADLAIFISTGGPDGQRPFVKIDVDESSPRHQALHEKRIILLPARDVMEGITNENQVHRRGRQFRVIRVGEDGLNVTEVFPRGALFNVI